MTEQHALYTRFLLRKDNKEGIKCTKAKEQLNSYCPNINTYWVLRLLDRLCSKTQSYLLPTWTSFLRWKSSYRGYECQKPRLLDFNTGFSRSGRIHHRNEWGSQLDRCKVDFIWRYRFLAFYYSLPCSFSFFEDLLVISNGWDDHIIII